MNLIRRNVQNAARINLRTRHRESGMVIAFLPTERRQSCTTPWYGPLGISSCLPSPSASSAPLFGKIGRIDAVPGALIHYAETTSLLFHRSHSPGLKASSSLGVGRKLMVRHAAWAGSFPDIRADNGVANCSSDRPSAFTPSQSSAPAPRSIMPAPSRYPYTMLASEV